MQRQQWTHRCDGLEYEIEQLKDEGRAVPAEFEQAVAAALKLPDGPEKDALASELFTRAQKLPYAAGIDPEPSELAEILVRTEDVPAASLDGTDLFDKIYGGWLARCAGCLLGKPVEGWSREAIEALCRDQQNYPIRGYLTSAASEAFLEKYGELLHPQAAFIDRVDGMPEDDDTNYTIIGLKLLKEFGRDFTSDDVAALWLNNLPYYHLCTAERVTYRNLVECIEPPQSTVFCNAYREWIGAQIRADIFGYVNPGDPKVAAEMAWRDASISHVKNGIYGEMWVAAMIAAAFVQNDVAEIIRIGLKTIPAESRLTAAVRDALAWRDECLPWQEVIERIHRRWNEANKHHWCHTVANAQIVAAALLYGEGSLEKTLSFAVLTGFDTDCNGATAASVLGVMLGAKALPPQWIAPLNDTLYSGVDGFNRNRISDLARLSLGRLSLHPAAAAF